MKILMIGDIVARPGRQIVESVLPEVRREYGIDWVVANGENLAGGRGLNRKTLKQITDAGVDVVTTGNHVWFNDEGVELLKKKSSPILRPANYPPDIPGRGWGLFTNALGQQLIVINLIGRVFMRENYDCPFRQTEKILNDIKNDPTIKNIDAIVIDFHAEATAEKMALAKYFDGQVTAVIGTHTHVTTADAEILKKGTAYLTDLGMTGTMESILGVEEDIIIEQFLSQLPQKFVWKTSGRKKFNAMLIETKKGSIKALSIDFLTRVSED